MRFGMIRITLIIASLLAISAAQAGSDGLVPHDEGYKPLRPRTKQPPLLYDGPPPLQIGTPRMRVELVVPREAIDDRRRSFS
jgi:hypothetical protein